MHAKVAQDKESKAPCLGIIYDGICIWWDIQGKLLPYQALYWVLLESAIRLGIVKKLLYP